MIRKPLTEYGFTSDQLRAIYNFLRYAYQTSQEGNEKLEGVEYFIDKANNFYVSYCLKTTEGGQETTALKYIVISEFGETTDLTPLYDNPNDLVKRYEKFYKIEIV